MSVSVVDPFGVSDDSSMPSLARAIDPAQVDSHFQYDLPRLTGNGAGVFLRAIRVTRYKPQRRCLIEYDIDLERPGSGRESMTLIGKVRVHRPGKSGYRLLRALWKAGFNKDARDGISVPQPVGKIVAFQMWLQRKVHGRILTEVLGASGGAAWAPRVAEAAHKLHQSGVPTERSHRMADEVRILGSCLPSVARIEPRWARRVERILLACNRLGKATPEPREFESRGIHRDFYSDQVIVDGDRLYIVDFDEYCLGDPALDIGNFLGSTTDHSLRTLGDPDALADVECAIEERFAELAGEATRPAMRAYAVLTLVRHIYLSTTIPERSLFVARLLELSEERLAKAIGAAERTGIANFR